LNDPIPQTDSRAQAILVCGLGTLGLHCTLLLKQFGFKVFAIDRIEPHRLEGFDPDQVDAFVNGDFRDPKVLVQAGIGECRAALLLADDERTNIAAAFAVRAANPALRLVVRSAQDNLNRLLAAQLGNFSAIEPTSLSAAAFAHASLGDEILAVFDLGEDEFSVRQIEVGLGHEWCVGRALNRLNTSARRVLAHSRPGAEPGALTDFDGTTIVAVGDRLAFVERAEVRRGLVLARQRPNAPAIDRRPWRPWTALRRRWQEANQVLRITTLAFFSRPIPINLCSMRSISPSCWRSADLTMFSGRGNCRSRFLCRSMVSALS
jgi:Trk K+ transport system NAD-binding subunit